MAKTKPTSKIIVVLPAKERTPISTFIIEMQHVHDMLNGNSNFTIAATDLTQFQTDINLLGTDETNVLNHMAGAAGILAEKKKEVLNEADAFRAIVQTTVNKPANIANAVGMVASAGMLIKGKTTKADLTARKGLVSGQVILIKKSVGKRAAYLWMQSTDNVTFVYCNPICTIETKVTISGLTPTTNYWFKCIPVLPIKKAKKTTGTSSSTSTTEKVAPGVGQATQTVKITVV